MRGIRTALLITLACGFGLGIADAQAPTALQRVRQSGTLRVGIDATYPPFGMAEGGDFSGFDVDIARAVARELGVRAELINASFDGVFPALQNGTFDAVCDTSATLATPWSSISLSDRHIVGTDATCPNSRC